MNVVFANIFYFWRNWNNCVNMQINKNNLPMTGIEALGEKRGEVCSVPCYLKNISTQAITKKYGYNFFENVYLLKNYAIFFSFSSDFLSLSSHRYSESSRLFSPLLSSLNFSCSFLCYKTFLCSVKIIHTICNWMLFKTKICHKVITWRRIDYFHRVINVLTYFSHHIHISQKPFYNSYINNIC